jgi:hypothetical protein
LCIAVVPVASGGQDAISLLVKSVTDLILCLQFVGKLIVWPAISASLQKDFYEMLDANDEHFIIF